MNYSNLTTNPEGMELTLFWLSSRTEDMVLAVRACRTTEWRVEEQEGRRRNWEEGVGAPGGVKAGERPIVVHLN